jgi:hypothetical protein
MNHRPAWGAVVCTNPITKCRNEANSNLCFQQKLKTKAKLHPVADLQERQRSLGISPGSVAAYNSMGAMNHMRFDAARI